MSSIAHLLLLLLLLFPRPVQLCRQLIRARCARIEEANRGEMGRLPRKDKEKAMEEEEEEEIYRRTKKKRKGRVWNWSNDRSGVVAAGRYDVMDRTTKKKKKKYEIP